MGRFDQRVVSVQKIAPDGAMIVDGRPVHLLGLAMPSRLLPEAQEYLQSRIARQPVTLRLEPMRTRDRQGRLVAYVYIQDELLNLDLIQRGLAAADPSFRHPYSMVFSQAERQARKKKLGLWAMEPST